MSLCYTSTVGITSGSLLWMVLYLYSMIYHIYHCIRKTILSGTVCQPRIGILYYIYIAIINDLKRS